MLLNSMKLFFSNKSAHLRFIVSLKAKRKQGTQQVLRNDPLFKGKQLIDCVKILKLKVKVIQPKKKMQSSESSNVSTLKHIVTDQMREEKTFEI